MKQKSIFLIFFGICSVILLSYWLGYEYGYSQGSWDGKYNSFDEIWKSGYADGYVWGYQTAVIWPHEYNHDAYIYYYNNSVWNWENGTSALESWNELTQNISTQSRRG